MPNIIIGQDIFWISTTHLWIGIQLFFVMRKKNLDMIRTHVYLLILKTQLDVIRLQKKKKE